MEEILTYLGRLNFLCFLFLGFQIHHRYPKVELDPKFYSKEKNYNRSIIFLGQKRPSLDLLLSLVKLDLANLQRFRSIIVLFQTRPCKYSGPKRGLDLLFSLAKPDLANLLARREPSPDRLPSEPSPVRLPK